MKRLLAGGLVAALAVLLAACGSSSSSPDPDPQQPPPTTPPAPAQLQVIHASADAPGVNVLVNGEVPAGLAGVPFAAASPYLELPPEEISAAVNAILADGSEVEVLSVPALALESDVAYTVIAAGSTAALLAGGDAANPLRMFLLERSVVEAIAGARIQVLHGAPSAPEVDVYVTAPDGALENPATFDFGEVLDLGVVPAATYRIRVTLPGEEGVVFDSGPVALPDNADLSIIAVDNTGPASPGASPIQLLAVLGDGTVLTLRDGGEEAPAGLTAVHNAFDAPEVCVVAASDAIDRAELFAGVPFRGFGYTGAVPPGTYSVSLEVFDAGSGCSGTPVITFDDAAALSPGEEATAIVLGTLGSELELLALPDDLRAIATEARLRIVHGASLVHGVDIFVVAPGTDISDPAVEPAFSGVEFKDSTGFVAIPPGNYDVFVTLAGDRTPAISLPDAELDAGVVGTVIASDPEDPEDPPGLIVINHVELKSAAATL